MQRLCGGLLPASSVDSPLTERLLQLLAIVEQNSCQLALLAADHFAGATLIDCFVTLVSGAVAATTPNSAAASGGDSSAAGSVNIHSLNELLRSKEFHSFMQKRSQALSLLAEYEAVFGPYLGKPAKATHDVVPGANKRDNGQMTQAPGSNSGEVIILADGWVFVSGHIWSPVKLGDAYGQDKCLAFVCSRKAGDNRMSHCESHGKAGHESPSSSAHAPYKVHPTLPAFDPADADQKEAYGRSPTEEEKAMFVKQLSEWRRSNGKRPVPDFRHKPGKASGSSDKGKGSPNFRQPKTA
jgi:hypothetical protein